MDYRHHFFAGQRIARTTVTVGAEPFVYCGYDPINRTDADGGGGAGLGKITKPPVLWHVQIQKPDMSGPTLWDAIVRLFTGSSSSSSSSDESAEKEGEPEGKKKEFLKKANKFVDESENIPGTGQRYKSLDAAGYNASIVAYALTIATGWEFGGIIYQDEDGMYWAEYPQTTMEKDKLCVDCTHPGIGSGKSEAGTKAVAIYHGHETMNRLGNREVNRMGQDADAGLPGIIFVGTPKGVAYYNGYTNQHFYVEWGGDSFGEGHLFSLDCL